MTYPLQPQLYRTIFAIPSDDWFEGYWVVTTRPWNAVAAEGNIKEIGAVSFNEDGHKICLPIGHPVLQDHPLTDLTEASVSKYPLKSVLLNDRERLAEHYDFLDRMLVPAGKLPRYKEYTFWSGLGDTDRFLEEAMYMRFLPYGGETLKFAAELIEKNSGTEISRIELSFTENGRELTVSKVPLRDDIASGSAATQTYYIKGETQNLRHG